MIVMVLPKGFKMYSVQLTHLLCALPVGNVADGLSHTSSHPISQRTRFSVFRSGGAASSEEVILCI